MAINCLIISIACLGFYNATRYGQVLYFVQRIASVLPTFIGKPVCLCLRCMASLHTLVIYPLLFSTDIAEILVAILVVSGMNSIIEKYAD